MDARSRWAQSFILLAVAVTLLQAVGSVQAAEPPPILLKVIVDASLDLRFARERQNWAAFETRLGQGAVNRIEQRGYWSIFCWPLVSDPTAPCGGELHVLLEMQPSRKNWEMNVQFVRKGRKDLIGKFTLFKPNEYPTVINPGPNELGDYYIAEWLWEHVLKPQSPTPELPIPPLRKAHALLRKAVPIGEGEVAPPELALEPDYGIVLTDHPILARNQRRFLFLPNMPAAQPLPTVGTGGTIPFQVGAVTVPCIVVQFEQAPPPAPGTQGAVFLAEFADPSEDDALLFH